MTDDIPSSDPQEHEVEEAVTETCADSISHRLPKQIGRFHIKGVLASGGMGVVYRAVQDQPRRTVAVKVMKSGIASRSAMRRFEYESQVLARLRHPGIAQVFEAGTHDDGTGIVPYFAMEYIPNAKPITKFAKEKGLGTRERLELFLTVCDAVHHGHQKGIIHRDLKPDNILVDPEGIVKIIDFGVARGTDSDLAVTTLQTDVGQLVGTLQYMSPEQCEADPDAIDARSDIYALGVVLYELVTGRLPYSVSRKHVFDGTQVIREHQPARLSTIDKTLRGDVETMVLKALEKEPSRRYQTATDLAHDIRSYLSGDAIAARPPSTVYQLQLYAKRNRGPLTAVAAIFAVIIASCFMVFQSRDKAEQAEVMVAAALRRAAKAEKAAAASKAVGVSEDASTADLIGKPVPRFALTTQGEKTVGTSEFVNYEATILNFVAMDCPHCLRQIAKVESIRAEYEAQGVRFVNIVMKMFREFKPDEAYRLLEQIGSKLEVAMDVKSANGEFNSVGKMFHVGGYPKMCVVTKRGRLRYVNTGNRGDMASHLRGQLESILHGIPTPQERLAQTEVGLRKALRKFRRELGNGHKDTIAAMQELAENLTQQREYSRAEKLYREIWTLQNQIMGETDSSTLATMHKLGEVLQESGDYVRAESMHHRTLANRKRALGDDHPDTLLSMAHLGLALHSQGRKEGVRPYMKELIELKRRATLVKDVQSKALNDYAWLLITCKPEDLRDPASAITAAERAAKLSGRHNADILHTLAVAHKQSGDLTKAIEIMKEAVSVMSWDEFKAQWDMQQELISYLKEAEDFLGVEMVLRDKVESIRSNMPSGAAGVVFPLGELAGFYLEQGRYSEAEATAREGLAIAEVAFPDDSQFSVGLQIGLGVALAGQGKPSEANPILVELIRNSQGMNVGEVQRAEFVQRIIKIYDEQGLPEEADKFRALQPSIASPQSNSP